MAPPLNDASNKLAFEPFSLPSSNQRTLGPPHLPNTSIPLALKPTSSTTLEETISTIKHLQKTQTLTTLLSKHSALLFRNLPLSTPHDFSAIAHAFGFPPHHVVGKILERPSYAPNVGRANENPPDTTIYMHNESPQVPHAPEYIFFTCLKADMKSGGETPVASSLELFQRVRAEIPEFIDKLVEKGTRTKAIYKPKAWLVGGTTMEEAWGIEEGLDAETLKVQVEKQIARYGRGKFTTWEWIPEEGQDGETLIVYHHLPVIRTQPGTNLPLMFFGLTGPEFYHHYLYGDGTPIPIEYAEKVARIQSEIRVLHKWEVGDVLVCDNRIAQHGREPWDGVPDDRLVLASVFDGELPGPFGFGEWAKLCKPLD